VACLLQYLEGSIARPGLWLMGQAVDPVRLVEDMERMGVEVHASMTAPGVPADP
jgi:saccharopine dehydrogenase (NAD+, L-lysine-forming)